jgi:hypothetical protein
MAEKVYKCGKCGREEQTDFPIKGANNTKLCYQCGRNVCFQCDKKEEKFR